MSYGPVDTFSRGPAALPNFVGGHVEAAVQYGAAQGWTVHERTVEPAARQQFDGMVVGQQPFPGVVLDGGDVVLVDVVRRVPWISRHAAVLWAALAGIATVLAVVFGLVLLTDDDDADAPTEEPTAELAAAQERIRQLEEQLAAAGDGDAMVATLQAQLAEATTRITELDAELADVQQRLDQTSADLLTVTADRDALVLERDALLQRVADLEAELGGLPGEVTATPDFAGQQQVAVEEFVRLNTFVLVVRELDELPDGVDDEPDRGTVLAQLPEPGTPLVPGSAIVIDVWAPAP